MKTFNQKQIISLAKNAKGASRDLISVPTETKDLILCAMADNLVKNKALIISANKKDLNSARKYSLAFRDRLTLTEGRLNTMAESLKQISQLRDPVFEVMKTWDRPNGLRINKVRVPIGVIAIIYESRPNVTGDCIGLCLKSSNAIILRGGSEAINSNMAIHKILQDTAVSFGIAKEAINLIQTTDRRAVKALLELNQYIDLVIPRGGESLIKEVARLSRIPVIKHYKGVCHVYVDKTAQLDMAYRISFNAKVQRPGVCNAMETLLVHKDIAKSFLPEMLRQLKYAKVEIRGCKETLKIVKGLKRATEDDWYREYLDLIVSVKVVRSLDEAIAHINKYGSSHSDSIICTDNARALKFLNLVDSACVYHNASTRFTDGYEFGMGAEIGISTDKIHARGPMALEELTTYKYTILGNGQIRQ